MLKVLWMAMLVQVVRGWADWGQAAVAGPPPTAAQAPGAQTPGAQTPGAQAPGVQALLAARAAACAYEDAVTLVLADAELAVNAALQSPRSGDAATAERRSRAQQATRGRKLLRESLQRLQGTQIKALVQTPAESLPSSARASWRALLDEVHSDQASLAQVLELLADRGPDRFASFVRAQRRVQDLQKGSPAQRRRAVITEIRKLAGKSP